MDRRYRRPIVTLRGGGDAVTLDGVGHGLTLKPGMTGTGGFPLDHAFEDLPSGGSLLVHSRPARRTIMIPIDSQAGSYQGLEAVRRRLEDICYDEQVAIEIASPAGVRTAYGVLKDGLEGDFSWAKDRQSQPLALTFDCADPRFYGARREQAFELVGKRKPFITGVSPEAVRYNLATNPGGEQDAPAWWRFGGADAQTIDFDTSRKRSGSRALKITSGEGSGTPHALSPALRPSPPTQPAGSGGSSGGAVPASAGVAMSTTVTMGAQVAASEAVTHVRVSCWQSDGTVWKAVTEPTVHRVTSDWTQIRHTAARISPTYLSAFQFQLLRSIGGQLQDVPPGESLWVDELQVEPGEHLGAWFDGDSTATGRAYEWLDGPGSQSVERAAATTGSMPFFPIRLSSSTVAGEHIITVEGTEPVAAVATVTGPGSDVRITAGDQELLITGEVRDQITIDSRQESWDITDASGDLWSRVTGDPSVLHMRPGANRVRVSMLAATPASQIVISWRDTYRAGH